MELPPWAPKIKYERLRIAGKKVVLRPATPRDFAAWKAGWGARTAPKSKYDESPKDIALVDRRGFLKRLKDFRKRAESGSYKLDIFHKKTGEHLGFVSIQVFDKRIRWANLGYQVHNHQWGKGYASEAASLALKLAFGPLDLYRVEAGCEPGNRRSRKVILNAGLRYEGRRKNFFVDKAEGTGKDLLVFGIDVLSFSH